MSTELSTSTVFISRSDNGRLFYVRDAERRTHRQT